MRLLLLDGHNLLYRAFTSLPATIVDHERRPIHGVYGLVGATLRLIRDIGATHVVAAFDVPDVPTFRHVAFPAYQGQRGPMGGDNADDFLRQTAVAARVLPSMNVPVLTLPGYEADDVMGTLAEQAATHKYEAVIVSTDRDLLQLIRPGISIVAPGNPPRPYRTVTDVIDRLGVPPSGITTLKALAGDPSDNIPGVTGIGVKTAAALVVEYGGLEEIIANIDDLPKRASAVLRNQIEQARLFHDLVTVRRDAPVHFDLDTAPSIEEFAGSKVREILSRSGYGRPDS